MGVAYLVWSSFFSTFATAQPPNEEWQVTIRGNARTCPAFNAVSRVVLRDGGTMQVMATDGSSTDARLSDEDVPRFLFPDGSTEGHLVRCQSHLLIIGGTFAGAGPCDGAVLTLTNGEHDLVDSGPSSRTPSGSPPLDPPIAAVAASRIFAPHDDSVRSDPGGGLATLQAARNAATHRGPGHFEVEVTLPAAYGICSDGSPFADLTDRRAVALSALLGASIRAPSTPPREVSSGDDLFRESSAQLVWVSDDAGNAGSPVNTW